MRTESRNGGRDVFIVDDGAWYRPSLTQEYRIAGRARFHGQPSQPLCWFGRLRGDLDQGLFSEVLHQMVNRHPALRTRFEWRDGTVRARTESAEFCDWPIEVTGAETERAARRVLRRFADREFNLESGPIVSASLVDVGSMGCFIGLAVDHVVCDGYGMDLLLADISRLYNARVTESQTYAPPSVTVRELAERERQDLAAPAGREKLELWAKRFGTQGLFPPPLGLAGLSAPVACLGPTKISRAELDTDVIARVRDRMRTVGATLYMGLLSATLTGLRRVGTHDRVGVVTLAAGRGAPGAEDVVGCFVNQMQVVASLPTAARPLDVLEGVQDQVFDILEHEVSHWRVLEHMGVPLDERRSVPRVHFTCQVDDEFAPIALLGTRYEPITISYQLVLKEPMVPIRIDKQQGRYALTVEHVIDDTTETVCAQLLREIERAVSEMT